MKRILGYIDRIERLTLVWIILGLAVIGFVQVFSRYIFNYSFTWFEELGRYLGVFIAFLGAGLGVKHGTHFSMDLLVANLPRPWKELLTTATNSVSATFLLIIAYYSWKIVIKMHGFETTSAAMQIPMYLAYLPIPVFCMVMSARFFLCNIEPISSLLKRGNNRSEGAVP